MMPTDYQIRLVGHSLGAGACALITGLLKADAQFAAHDIRAHGAVAITVSHFSLISYFLFLVPYFYSLFLIGAPKRSESLRANV